MVLLFNVFSEFYLKGWGCVIEKILVSSIKGLIVCVCACARGTGEDNQLYYVCKRLFAESLF